jgi:polar amino acid transport system permease protein
LKATILILGAALSFTQLLSYGDTGYGDEMLWGAFRTLQISFFGYAFGLFLGLLGAIGKLFGGDILRFALNGYTTILRAIPELILILLLYYAGTDSLNTLLAALGREPIQVNGLVAAVVVLGIVQGAYATEILRAAIQAVNIGQIEAARAFGMTPFQSFKRVILPAMMPNAVPGMCNLWLEITKASALISVVGFTELALATRQAAGVSKQYLVLFLVAQAIYLTISVVSIKLFARAENKYRRGQQKLSEA